MLKVQFPQEYLDAFPDMARRWEDWRPLKAEIKEIVQREHQRRLTGRNAVGQDKRLGPAVKRVQFFNVIGRDVFYGGDDVDAWGKPVEAFLPPWLLNSLKQMFLGQQQHGGVATDAEVGASAEAVGHPLRTFEDFAKEQA